MYVLFNSIFILAVLASFPTLQHITVPACVEGGEVMAASSFFLVWEGLFVCLFVFFSIRIGVGGKEKLRSPVEQQRGGRGAGGGGGRGGPTTRFACFLPSVAECPEKGNGRGCQYKAKQSLTRTSGYRVVRTRVGGGGECGTREWNAPIHPFTKERGPEGNFCGGRGLFFCWIGCRVGKNKIREGGGGEIK